MKKSKKLTKKDILNYFVDVLGYNENESKKISALYGTRYLEPEQSQECKQFNN